jgi:predicted dehydrogenase
MKTAEATKKILMVGYQRRYDSEFLRLKGYVNATDEKPWKIQLSSADPVSANWDTFKPEDLKYVLWNSICHEFDILCWIYPNSQISFKLIKAMPNSGVYILGEITHDFGPTTSFEIRHEKAHWKSYDNIVKVYSGLSREPEVFGHEFIVPKKGVYWEAYDNAYKRELEFFARLVKGEAYEPGLMKTYLKTYNLHVDACRFIDEQASG